MNNKNKFLTAKVPVIFFTMFLSLTRIAAAQVQNPIKFGNLEELIANIVKSALGLTAVVAVGFIVYGGFLYISAAGDDSQIKKGKEVLVGAIIGIVLIGLAYSIVAFVIGAVGAGGDGTSRTGV